MKARYTLAVGQDMQADFGLSEMFFFYLRALRPRRAPHNFRAGGRILSAARLISSVQLTFEKPRAISSLP